MFSRVGRRRNGMADKVTFDFENGKIHFDTDSQQGTEIDPDLKKKKAAIMAAAGYEMVDVEDFKESIRDILRKLGHGDVEI
jgi:hypothetical protein